MMNPMSPEWKKPSDIMKIHRKKKVIPRGYMASRGSSLTVSPANSPRPTTEQSPRNKRKNPFGCSPRKGSPRKRANMASSSEVVNFRRESPRKKMRLNFNATEQKDSSGVLLDVLNTKDRFSFAKDSKSPKKMPPVSYPVLPEPPQKPDSQSSAEADDDERYPLFPCDWSLKMKARFTSTESFAWCGSLKTVDEACGMERFIQKSSPPIDLQGKPPSQCPFAKAELHKCCLYWVHPNIPWLKLFPRMVTDSKIGKTSVVLQDKQVLESIMNDWITSFTSAFHLLRAGSCPYLYMCCHQFTVAFFAAKTRSDGPMEAIVTPTSRGFREALKNEGIEFSLPLQPKSQSESSPKSSKETNKNMDAKPDGVNENIAPGTEEVNSQTTKTEDEDEEDEDDLEQTDEGAASWLETLGLDKRRYRSLDPSKVKLQREGYRLIDNRPESTIHIKGAEVQALFNYLLNCRSCVANTGVQGGVPPTLIAPTAFNGATLKTLKMKHGNLRRQHANQPPQYSLEVIGPILPSSYTGLNTLFTATQQTYTATYSVHEPTAPFNVGTEGEEVPEEPLSVNRSDLSINIPLGKEAIRELVCNEKRFTWVHY